VRLLGRVNRLEQKQGGRRNRFARSAFVTVDSRYPRDRLDRYIAEHGFDAPDCLLFINSYECKDDDEMVELSFDAREMA